MNIHYKIWDEITYLFEKCSGATIEALEWIGYFIPHFIGHVLFIQAGVKVKSC